MDSHVSIFEGEKHKETHITSKKCEIYAAEYKLKSSNNL